MTAVVVLDSSALLAAILDEPGRDMVAPLLGRSLICAVNVTEVISRLYDLAWPSEAIDGLLPRVFGRIAPFDDILAFRAAALRNSTRKRGLSVGDRACLALAGLSGYPVYTADREWALLDLGLDIRLIR